MKILFNRNHISFGTMMDDGATSLYECLELKGIGQPRSLATPSYNHPMHSGFGYFLYADLAGIRPLEPGFASFEICPCTYTDVPHAEVTHMTPYGEIAVSFTREGQGTVYTFTVPANTTCRFRAGGMDDVYGSGTYTVTV